MQRVLIKVGVYRRGYRKEGGVHDPFAELTGITRAQPKQSPPLKKLGGSSSSRPGTAAAPPAPEPPKQAQPAPSPAAPAAPSASPAASGSLGSFAAFPAANGTSHAPVQRDFAAGSFEPQSASNGSLI